LKNNITSHGFLFGEIIDKDIQDGDYTDEFDFILCKTIRRK
jgi:hypothetical protein